MARLLTTSNLVADVRSLIDENNATSVSDESDIIPALNRAQDVAANILARHYESPLLAYEFVPLTTAQEYPIPRTAFENRLEKVEVQIQNGLFQPVKRQSYRDATLLETTAHTSIPLFYSEIGDVFRLYPSPTGAYPLRVWYLKDPPPLVLEQGTVTGVNLAQNYVIVDAVGTALTTDASQTSSYVNFVDYRTGNTKGTAQIQSITNNTITFKTLPNRQVVLDQPIGSGIPPTVGPDDLLCTVDGTCIPVLKKPFSNYLINMAASEILNTKLGMTSELGEKVRLEMQNLVKESWVGRESYVRVRSASPAWERVGRRFGNRF
jgi:hypothetical protein